MKKRILLIGYNFHPEPTGIGKYNGEMISWFVKQGYDCTVITSYPYYPFWKVQEPYYKNRLWYCTEESSDLETNGKLKIFRCPQYVPVQPSGFKRVLLDLSFVISAFFPLLKLLTGKKFDFVITVAPAFQIGLLGLLYKKIRKAKLLYHIQDLQIEAARDLKMIKSKWVINTLFKVEQYIFKRADIISSISKGMVDKIAKKANKNVLLFPNWTDTTVFYPIEDKAQLKRDFGFDTSDRIILYSGSIGEKQGIDSILHVANELKDLKNLKFVICGSGPYKQNLQSIAEQLDLQNVNFFPIQPHSKFNEFLNLADVHLVIQKAGASDLVMPSKITTILSVGGLAIITANKGSDLHTLFDDHNMGVLVEAENTAALKECIVNIINKDCTEINKNARKYAENSLSIEKIMLSFERLMHQNTTLSSAKKAPVLFTPADAKNADNVSIPALDVPVVPKAQKSRNG
jgi:colanic acid biosynthesis glycosyl transferase WcaI